MSGWKDNAAEQNLRMAQKMLEQQGEINRMRAVIAAHEGELGDMRAQLTAAETDRDAAQVDAKASSDANAFLRDVAQREKERAEKAEAEVAEIGAALDREHGFVKRLEAKVAHLPHDIAEAILLRAERTKDWSGTPRSPVADAWRRGLQDAAAIARTPAEAPDA